MIYQYPQPWLQTYWQQTMTPPGQPGGGALSPAMPAMGGQRMAGSTGNVFAPPAALFGQRKRRQQPGVMPFGVGM